MARPKGFEHNRWMGDKHRMRVHDLDSVTDGCDIDAVMAAESFAAIGPDILAEAHNRGYESCPHCALPATD